MTPGRSLLFDLDGTLVDTAPDMVAALNLLLRQRGRREVPEDQARVQVSHGVRGLLGLGFGISPEDAEYPALARAFLETYQMLDHRNSGLFPQWQPWLTAVPAGKLGIVTNKPRYLTERLLRVLHLEEHFGVVICGDDFDEKKPHPRPLLEAAARLGCAPGDCCYFGDSERDMAAARSAGQKAILVNWGYFDEHDAPEDWPWDQRVQSGDQAHRCCLDWLGPVL